MEKIYKQLTAGERVELYRMRKEGRSMQFIAKALDRSPSTISRELRRNSKPTNNWSGEYDPIRAQELTARRRRWDARFKLARDVGLREYVRERLEAHWSPEQIAGYLKRECGHCVISHESIYRFIYHCSAQKDYWHRLLPRRKSKRGRFVRRAPVDYIQYRVSIHQRAAQVDERASCGDWESDLMLFRRYKQAILVTHERRSRALFAHRQPNKAAAPVARQLLRHFRALPPALRRTLTIDNGTEFAHHYRLNQQLGMATYFCDPHAPWQKGGIENAIGRMRRWLPRKIDLATMSPHQLDRLVAAYNHTPRKCLGFNTPAAVLCEQLKMLHFKRECTGCFGTQNRRRKSGKFEFALVCREAFCARIGGADDGFSNSA